MKICQISPSFPYQEDLLGQQSTGTYRMGGVVHYVYSIAAEMDRLGHRVTIIAPSAPDHEMLTEVSLKNGYVHRIKLRLPVYSGALPLSLLKDLKPKEFDIIHTHTPMPTWAELAALRNLIGGTPFVLTYHNDVVGKGALSNGIAGIYGLTVAPFLLHRADVIVTTSLSYAESSRRLSAHLHKVKVAPCMVDTHRFHPGLSGVKVREKHGLGPGDKVILFVGQLIFYKGIEYLVRAMPDIISRVPEARLLIVGKGVEAAALREEARRLGVEAKVIFAGFVPDEDLPQYYAASNVFVLPSVSPAEGFGIVQLEALACARPIVTTTLPGVREVDGAEVATLHVPPRDPGALSDALARILGDDALARRMGENARQLCESKYTAAKVTEQFLKIYSCAIDVKRKGKNGAAGCASV